MPPEYGLFGNPESPRVFMGEQLQAPFIVGLIINNFQHTVKIE